MGYSPISSFSVLHSSQPTYNVFHSYVHNTVQHLYIHTYVYYVHTYKIAILQIQCMKERYYNVVDILFLLLVAYFHFIIRLKIVRMYDDGGKISYVHCHYMNIYILDNRIQSVDPIKYI